MKKYLILLSILTLSINACGKDSGAHKTGKGRKKNTPDKVEPKPIQQEQSDKEVTSELQNTWNLGFKNGSTADFSIHDDQTLQLILPPNSAHRLSYNASLSKDGFDVYSKEYKGVLTDSSNRSYPSLTSLILEFNKSTKICKLTIVDNIQELGRDTYIHYNTTTAEGICAN